jgi:hypothetical protein
LCHGIRYLGGFSFVGDWRGIGPVVDGVLSGGAGVGLAGGITGGLNCGVPGVTTVPGITVAPGGTGNEPPLPNIGPSVTGTP